MRFKNPNNLHSNCGNYVDFTGENCPHWRKQYGGNCKHWKPAPKKEVEKCEKVK